MAPVKPVKSVPTRTIEFSIAGKAGETKTVSRAPLESGISTMFKAIGIIATDTSSAPGRGTRIIGGARSGDQQISYGMGKKPLTDELFPRFSLHDTCYSNTCHPRVPIEFTIEFLEDCEWHAAVCGYVGRGDKPVYAITPTVACNRVVPVKWPRIDGGWYEGQEIDSDRRTRCDACWFEYGAHASWPYKECEHLLEALLQPDEMRDFFITVVHKSLLHRMRVPGGYDNIRSYDERKVWLDTQFRLRAFGVPGREKELKYSRDNKGPWAGFDIGMLPGALLEAGERLHIRVENVSTVEKLFKASVTGDAWMR
jgi:hypothetical protein